MIRRPLAIWRAPSLELKEMHMTRPCLIGGLAALLSLTAPAFSEPAPKAGDGEVLSFAGENAMRRINMGVGKSVILELPADAGEIFIGNPAVANAVVRSARKIYVIGQATGQTTIYAMDKQGKRIAALEISIGRDIGELQNILRAAMPNARITARTVNDSIILTGEVESALEMQTALDIAKGFVDATNNLQGSGPQAAKVGQTVNAMTIRGRDQVMIKVSIAEVQRNVAKQLGLSASTLAGNWGSFTQQNAFSIAGAPISTGALNTVSKFGGAWSLASTIQAFERNGVARMLAEPTVTAVSGEIGEIHGRRRNPDLRRRGLFRRDRLRRLGFDHRLLRAEHQLQDLWRDAQLHPDRSHRRPHLPASGHRSDGHRSFQFRVDRWRIGARLPHPPA